LLGAVIFLASLLFPAGRPEHTKNAAPAAMQPQAAE
jgi:hypothetical protein